MNELWERVSCLVFEENFAFFISIHFTLFFLCCVSPFALLTNHITVIRRTLIASLLADFLLNNVTLKCCTKSSVFCDAANRTCVLYCSSNVERESKAITHEEYKFSS